MDTAAEERQGGQGGRGTQAGQAGGPGGQASPWIRTGIRTGRGGNRESPGLGQQHTGGPRRQVAVGRGAGRPAAAAAPPDLRNMAETNGGRGLPGRPVHRGRPDSLRRGVAGTRMFHTLQSALERAAGRGLQLQLQALEAYAAMTPRWGYDDQQGNASGPHHEPPEYEPPEYETRWVRARE